MIYLDHNSTSPLHPEVLEAMQRIWRGGGLNPSSLHAAGQQAQQLLEVYRERIAELLGAAHARIIFTSGGTEANNLALLGIAQSRPGPLVVAAVEHPSVWEAAVALRRAGREVVVLPCSRQGVTELEPLAELLGRGVRPALVCLMYGNNETGVVQPVQQAAEICRSHAIPVHCDAVQAVGKRSLDVTQLGCGSMSLAAHKMEGPAGIGALVLDRSLSFQPLFWGGPQQYGFRPGTEPLALIAGLVAALERWQRNRTEWIGHLGSLRQRFETRLAEHLGNLVVLGGAADRLAQTSNLSFPGWDRQALLMGLDLAGICCSTGSACSSGSSEPSRVLQAMGWPKEVVEGSLRFSFGPSTTKSELDTTVDRILSLVKDLRVGGGSGFQGPSGRGGAGNSL